MEPHTIFERRYLQLADSLPDGLLLVNSVGMVILANKAAAGLLGFDAPADLMQTHVSAFYANAADHDSLLSIVGYKGSAERTIFDWKKKNGDPILAEITACPVRNDEGHIEGIHVMFRDITSRLRSQMAQQEVLAETTGVFSENRLLEIIDFYRTTPMSLFLQGIAHNFNTPLGSIRGRAELLQHNLQKNSHWMDRITDESVRTEVRDMFTKFSKGAGEIISQVDRLGEIIRGFTNKLSGEANRVETDVDLNKLVQHEISFFESSLYFKHKITRTVDLDPNLPKIRGTYRDFSEAFHELIVNSIRATANEGERLMEIRTRADEASIEIEVADNRPHPGDDDIGRLMTVHLDTVYREGPSEAHFGISDVEIPMARWYVERYDGDVRITSDTMTRLTLVIPRPAGPRD